MCVCVCVCVGGGEAGCVRERGRGREGADALAQCRCGVRVSPIDRASLGGCTPVRSPPEVGSRLRLLLLLLVIVLVGREGRPRGPAWDKGQGVGGRVNILGW